MTSIGDDVVDLHDIGGRHPRFDTRVFAPVERALLPVGLAGERLRWLLWAAKESAYKVARKHDATTVFSPSRFVVRLLRAGRATVTSGSRRFDVDLEAGSHYVHAVARVEGAGAVVVCRAVTTRPDGVAESLAVRQLAARRLGALLGLAPEAIAIRRDGRVPVLWIDGRGSAADLSLSHHGRFVSFACALPVADAPRSMRGRLHRLVRERLLG